MLKRKEKKKKWADGPVVTRIKLNPDQAILTCCSTASGKLSVVTLQCAGAGCGYSGGSALT